MMIYSKTKNGIEYTEELYSSDGMAFMLFPTKEHTTEMVQQAIRELFNERDVVSMKVATEQDRDARYRSEIFAHPAVAHLRWYEINADDNELLRKEREQGTTTDAYIARWVMPFVTEIKQKNLNQFGDNILKL
jgi:hypothetical protein